MPEPRPAAKPIHFRSEEHGRITVHTQVFGILGKVTDLWTRARVRP